MPKKKFTPFNLPIPGWNERRMTSADFIAACEREEIQVYTMRFDDTTRGCYIRLNGKPTIFLDERVKGRNLTYVQFHELGHYFMHDWMLKKPSRFFSFNGSSSKVATSGTELPPDHQWAELEATAVGMLAVAPGFNLGHLIRRLTPKLARIDWLKGNRMYGK